MNRSIAQQEREARTALRGQMRYTYDEAQSGLAYWLNVSRTGAAVRLGRYLRPGRQLCLLVADPNAPDRVVEVRARVVWCRPVGDGSQFFAGLGLLRQRPEEALAIYRWVQRARQEKGALLNKSLVSEVVEGVWPGFEARASRAVTAAKAV